MTHIRQAMRPRWERWRRWARALGVGCVLVALGYVSLPWWLPTGWLARRIEAQLTHDLGRPVSIERLRLGWVEGVVIEGLSIHDLPDASNPLLARVGRVRCGLTPLRTLATGRVDRIEVTRPELWLVRDAEGRLNVEKLPPLPEAGLPTLSYHLEDVICHVWTPEARQTYTVEAIRCRLEPRDALLDLSVIALSPTGRRRDGSPAVRGMMLDTTLTVPRLRPELDLKLGGEVRVEWSNVALGDLPLSLAPALPIAQVGGVSSGRLTLETHGDLSVDFSQQVALKGVRLNWVGLDRPAVAPDAVLRCEGHWDPNLDRITFRQLDFETPAVRVRNLDGWTIAIDPRGGFSIGGRLAGEIKDWRLLRAEAPHLDSLADAIGLEMEGPSTFTAELARQGPAGEVLLTLDGAASQWVIDRGAKRIFEAGAGVPKQIEVAVDADLATGRFEPRVQASIGELHLSLSGEGPGPWSEQQAPGAEREGHSERMPGVEWARLLESVNAQVEVRTDDAAGALALFPAAGGVPELSGWAGPMTAELNVAGGADGGPPRLRFALKAGDEATLGWGPWLEKPRGAPLSMEAGVRLPPRLDGPIDDVVLNVAYRQADVRIAPGQARGRLRLSGLDDFNVEALLPLTIGHVEDFTALCPRWRELVANVPERDVTGTMGVVAELQVERQAGESLTLAAATMDASALDLRWDDALDKPAGEPLKLRVAGQSYIGADRREERAGVTLERSDGQVEVTYQRTASASGHSQDGVEQYAFTFRTESIERLLRCVPALARRLEEIEPRGSVEARVNVVAQEGRESMELSVDAGGAAFVLPGETPGHKPAGVPAAVTMRWEHEAGAASEHNVGAARTDDGLAPVGSWELTDGSVCLAGMNVTKMAGYVAGGETPSHGIASDPWLWEALAANPFSTGDPEGGQDARPPKMVGGLEGGQDAYLPKMAGISSPGEADVPAPGEADMTARGGAGILPASWGGTDASGWTWDDILAKMPPLEVVHLRCEGEVVWDDALSRLHPALAELRERLGLAGRLQWQTSMSGNEQAFRWSGRVDAGGLSWDAETGAEVAPVFRKPAGVPAVVEMELAGVGEREGMPARIDTRVAVDLDGTVLDVDGRAWVDGLLDGRPRVAADALVGVSLTEGGEPLAFLPGAAVERIDGAGRFEVGIECRDEATRLTGGYARFADMSIAVGDRPVRLDGAFAWDSQGVRVPGLEWAWGESGGRLSGATRFVEGGLAGQIGLATDRIDVADLQRQVAGLESLSAALRAGRPAPGRAEIESAVRAALEVLARSDLHVDGGVEVLDVTLPPGILVRVNALTHGLLARDGALTFKFTGAVDGGLVQGQVVTRADTADPTMRLTYTAERIRPGPVVDAYLRQTFPGMTATGPLTLIDESVQKLLPGPGDANWPTGKGELIIHGGTVVGRAAPKAIARIFPGLNLARFDFSYMHSWFTKEASGRIHHQMIYQGKYYNIYMTGYSDPDAFRYEVGIDFLADFNSKYWAESGQGRIPMFTKTGRIMPDGSIADEQVVYMPERFFDTVLVKNNPIFTAYHAVRKRVREAE